MTKRKKQPTIREIVLKNFIMDVREFYDVDESDRYQIRVTEDEFAELEDLDGKTVTMKIIYDTSDEVTEIEEEISRLQDKLKKLKG